MSLDDDLNNADEEEDMRKRITNLENVLKVLRKENAELHPNVYEIDDDVECARRNYRTALRSAKKPENINKTLRMWKNEL